MDLEDKIVAKMNIAQMFKCVAHTHTYSSCIQNVLILLTLSFRPLCCFIFKIESFSRHCRLMYGMPFFFLAHMAFCARKSNFPWHRVKRRVKGYELSTAIRQQCQFGLLHGHKFTHLSKWNARDVRESERERDRESELQNEMKPG